MIKSAAIDYSPRAYNPTDRRIFGLQSANQGLLIALARDSNLACLPCYAKHENDFKDYCELFGKFVRDKKTTWFIRNHEADRLAPVGLLHRYDPLIGDHLWRRQLLDPTAYSVCGISHSIASRQLMEGIGHLLIAPSTEWDALVLTSEAVRQAVENIWSNWQDYFRERFKVVINPRINTTVIPLGVDCDFFDIGDGKNSVRQRGRHELNISDKEIVILYFGRFSSQSKAHPIPMYMAVEQAARSVSESVCFIMAGWFEDERQKNEFRLAVSSFCPSVKVCMLDGRVPKNRKNIWHMADVFVSLSDSIQETFGLTPLEAMAAGLPVIVSDWNGYRETIRDGIDGYKIPTSIPSGDIDRKVVEQYFVDGDFRSYYSNIAMMTAVDLPACVSALVELIRDPERRRWMGQNGRTHVRTSYAWSVIIRQYEKLWEELAEIREKAKESGYQRPRLSSHPICADPLRLFGHYASSRVGNESVFTVADENSLAVFDRLAELSMNRSGSDLRLDHEATRRLIQLAADKDTLSIGDITEAFAERFNRQEILATASYLKKFGIFRSPPK
ncbi:MAG: glycosyltransferase family 4 protein [Hyphomicrobiales bacterium]|nr:glycosyltransferase family 4 protein [Hyphomicrobiales bacterium]